MTEWLGTHTHWAQNFPSSSAGSNLVPLPRILSKVFFFPTLRRYQRTLFLFRWFWMCFLTLSSVSSCEWDRVALLITGSAKVIVLEASGDRVRTEVHIPFPSSGSSSHQFTLQFCPWSNFRLLGDHMGQWCESFQMGRDAYLRAARVNDISLSGLEWLWFF